MNTLRNTVSLIGNLGKDPVITQFGKDNSVARFSVATNESYNDKNGAWVTNTTWHNIVAWGKTAELCGQLLSKGSEVALEGKLVTNSYETKEGEKRFNTEISLREFIVINRNQDQNSDKKDKKSVKA